MANSRHSAAIFSPSSKRATKRTFSSITEHSFQGITPSPQGKKCHPCVRYKLSPMCQTAQIQSFFELTAHLQNEELTASISALSHFIPVRMQRSAKPLQFI